MVRPTQKKVEEREALRVQGLKRCTICKRTLPLSAFGPIALAQSSDGLRPQCRECANADFRLRYAHYRENATATPQRRKHLMKKYGITHDQYVAMKKSQDATCPLCLRRVDGVMHIDHDHNTGKVRGLLCYRCNNGLGCFDDNPKRLRAAIAYLRKHS